MTPSNGRWPSAVDRFWRRVEKTDGCWLWRGVVNNKGYGYFGVDRRSMLTHRFSYQLHKGDIPPGLLVCHTCDVPNCVNPEHLFLGTVKDNADDMVRKGRHKPSGVFGERHPMARLTREQVLAIREHREKTGESYMKIGARYGVHWFSIRKICFRETWAWL